MKEIQLYDSYRKWLYTGLMSSMLGFALMFFSIYVPFKSFTIGDAFHILFWVGLIGSFLIKVIQLKKTFFRYNEQKVELKMLLSDEILNINKIDIKEVTQAKNHLQITLVDQSMISISLEKLNYKERKALIEEFEKALSLKNITLQKTAHGN